MSGASWGMTFWRIVLPLLKPGLIAGWIYVVIVSVRELVKLNSAVQSRDRGRVDHDLGILAERPISASFPPSA